MEEWRAVVGFEGTYEVSDHGNVRNIRTGRPMKQTRSNVTGRPLLQLWRGGIAKMTGPHQLVLAAFVGPRPEGKEGCHNDGDPWHNHVSNLRWDTRKANHADSVRHGTQGVGERANSSKLTEAQVTDILADGRIYRLIAADYGVCHATISHIKNGRNWTHRHV